jgi:TPR repeat protein
LGGVVVAKASVDMSNWRPEEKAYSLWLRAAWKEAGDPKEFIRIMIDYLKQTNTLSYVPDKWSVPFKSEADPKWASVDIRRWETGNYNVTQPQQTTNEFLREALIRAVTELVPDPPTAMEWSTFRQVSDAFNTERRKRQERGGKETEPRAVRARDDERHHFLATRPSPAKTIDPVDLGLGSWAFNNDLPPYVQRTADQELAARLKSPGVTAVLGAPKSGKSRSIIEVLQQEHPEALTWWVNPSPTVLPLVVQAAKKAPKAAEQPVFVVLDDAGLIGTDPQHGLTAQRISELSKACTHLIVVIHEETLAGWEHQLTHRTPDALDMQSIGASQEMVDLLHHRVRYSSVLDNDEATPAAEAYVGADARVQGFDLTRLAETFAGVQILLANARKALENPTSIEAALLEAAIDASIAFPFGASLDVLEILAVAHYRRRQPNRPWRPHLLEAAFDALATGITVGSPHAILITTDHTTYRLMDALVPELQHPDRDVLDMLMTRELPEQTINEALYYIGSWHLVQIKFDKARKAWAEAARRGEVNSMLNISAFAHAEGDQRTARMWSERAAEKGSARGMYNLSVLAHEAGDADAARACSELAAEAGSAPAMLDLGILAHEEGDADAARAWWEQAAEAGMTEAMNNLGALADKEGNPDTAYGWWERAAAAGDSMAMANLGIIAFRARDLKTARIWLERAAENGSAEAIVNLGILADEEDDWERAVENGSAEAIVNLGNLAHEEGNADAARAWWKRAAAAGSAEAMYNLGALAHMADDRESARTWWERAAEAGDTTAMFNLGLLAYSEGDLAIAFSWWQRAARAGDANAMEALTDLAADQGDDDEAQRWHALGSVARGDGTPE